MSAWRLRVTATADGFYGHARGKVMDAPFETEADAEEVRRAMPNGGEFEVVEVDGDEEPSASRVGRVMHPSRSRPTPERCASLGHPGATFNAREGLTWCLCGAVITEGDTSVPHVACCDGPLVEVLP